MARSLQIQPEENPSTSPLLTGFLVIAVGWLLLTALFSAPTVDAAEVDATAPHPPELRDASLR